MFKKLLLGAVAACAIGLATPSTADAGHWHHHHRGNYGFRGGYYGRPAFYGPRVYSGYYGPGAYGAYGLGGFGGFGRRGGLWIGF